MVLRVLGLASWVWLLTQQLPPEDFGWVVTVLAVSAVCALVAPLGIPYLFFADARASPKYPTRWAEACGAILLVGPVLGVSAALVLNLWVESKATLPAVVVFMVLEVSITGLVQSAALWGHSAGRLGIASGLPAALTCSRALSAGLCLLVVSDEGAILNVYLCIHIVLAILIAGIVAVWIRGVLPSEWRPKKPSAATCIISWRYAAMGGAALAPGELDKPLLVRLLGLYQLGHYAMAYRVCAALAMPATALAASMLPRWASAFARRDCRLLRRSFLAALLSVFGLGVLLASLMFVLLRIYPPGSFGLYPEAWPWMQGLVCLAFVLALRQVAATALIAIDRPLARAVLDVSSLLVFIAGAFLAYPVLNIWGVILACLFGEIIAAIAMTTVFFQALVDMNPTGNINNA